MADRAGLASYLTYRAGSLIAQFVPPIVGEPFARGLGRVASAGMPERRRMVAKHMVRASRGKLRGLNLERAVTEVFDSYARYWVDMFRLPNEWKSSVLRNFSVEGYEHLETALAKGRGAIVVLPHLGGWEWGGAWIAEAKGEHIMVVVERVEPPELFEWFVQARSAMGMEVVAVGDDVATKATKALGDNRIVCLVSDRDLGRDGVPVEFFGEMTTLPAGPATLALRAGAALIPVAVYFERGRRHHGVIKEPIDTTRGTGRLRDDVARITQAMAYELEKLIEVAPEQWHLMQPNWPSDFE